VVDKPSPQSSPHDLNLGSLQSRLGSPGVAHQPHQRQGDRESAGDDGGYLDRYLTGPDVLRRYAVSDVSLWRWLKDTRLNFPQPALRINGRRYWRLADLLDWERARSEIAAA
jgi:predicted DNA-binding transcriptional regulator AlpA